MPLQSCAASAPGKVLLAGGFLVLDRKHTGLVFGLDARIHVHVSALPTVEGVTLQEIIVQSPQFKEATWRYGFHSAPHQGGVIATQLRSTTVGSNPNPFVETALSYALTYVSTLIQPVTIAPASVTILADNDYYSQSDVHGSASASATTSKFTDFGVSLDKAHKTGLGSSAALVTAFVAAILTYYLPAADFSVSSDSGRRVLHNLAQAAHSAAQGKVGSGFDVASACFGSCVYRRFSPSLINSIGEAGSKGFAPKLRIVVEEQPPAAAWDMEITKSKVTVPKGLRLVMCDVDCGSKTPGMVKKLLAWRQRCPAEALDLWTNIQSQNDRLAAELIALSKTTSASYAQLAGIIQDLRALVRDMSTQSDVPVEPTAQTRLLDACTDLPGVVGGVTPGAGGYDAVALLIEDKPAVLAELSQLLSQWKFEVDDPGVESTGKVRLLGVREEMEGIKLESTEQYSAWIR